MRALGPIAGLVLASVALAGCVDGDCAGPGFLASSVLQTEDGSPAVELATLGAASCEVAWRLWVVVDPEDVSILAPSVGARLVGPAPEPTPTDDGRGWDYDFGAGVHVETRPRLPYGHVEVTVVRPGDEALVVCDAVDGRPVCERM